MIASQEGACWASTVCGGWADADEMLVVGKICQAYALALLTALVSSFCHGQAVTGQHTPIVWGSLEFRMGTGSALRWVI